MTSATTKLTEALTLARKAAEATLSPWDDSGTCNFDSAVLFGLSGEDVETALRAAGLDGYYQRGSRGSMWSDCWFLYAPRSAQGFMRTKQAEAMAQELKAQGYKTTVYYQMD